MSSGTISHRKKVLIIFVNAIGDFVIFTSILPDLREMYKNHEITLLGYNRWESLMTNFPYIDRYIPFDRSAFFKNPLYQYMILKNLNNKRYDIVIYPSFSRTIMGDELVRACRAYMAIAFDGDLNNISLKRRDKNKEIYTKLISEESKNEKEIDHYIHFVEALGASKKKKRFPHLWIDNSQNRRIEILLESFGITDKDDFVVVCPGAASKNRVWNTAGYAKVCDHLYDLGFKIVMTGSTREKKLGDLIQTRTEVPIIKLIGKTSLPELATLYKRASYYIGSESGPLHISMAVGTPTICIMGGGHPFRFYPYGNLKKFRTVYQEMTCYGCNWKCIYPEVRCIQEISFKMVKKEIDTLTNLLKTGV